MADEFDPLKLGNQMCFPLYVCSKEIIRRYKPYLDPLDLTYTQYIALMVLWEQKHISVKELGEYLYLDSGTLTPVLKKLECKGYITRTRSASDERNVLVDVTEKGMSIKAEAQSVPYSMCSYVKLTDEERNQLHTLLVKLLKGFENE